MIGEVVSTCKPGPLLDAFAGMCSVGSEVGPIRQVWSNDLQHFSNLVAKVLFCAGKTQGLDEVASNVLRDLYSANIRKLEEAYSQSIEREANALRGGHEQLRAIFEEVLACTTHAGPRDTTYDLFTSRFGGTYFSFVQCMQIDSMRYAIDRALCLHVIAKDQADLLLVALAQAMSRCTSGPGHFAQPLAPKAVNLRRIVAQRKRDILAAMALALERIEPVGCHDWRMGNKVFHEDAVTLMTAIGKQSTRPSIVYADPPYTADQYSRYYHLYETLILYDYPECHGRGQYRDGRACSDFSMSRRVEMALSELIRGTSEMGADLIISYPSEGLLRQSTDAIPSLMHKHYGRYPVVHGLSHTHSTMGASKGAATASVTEHLYVVAA